MVPSESPPPGFLFLIPRALQVMIMLGIVSWVISLGGLRLSPKIDVDTGSVNDTSGIFNWHPLLMTFAFVGSMGEALMAYKRPLFHLQDRPARKLYHFSLQTVALLIGSFGILAAIKSHTLKRPDPLPNFYSVHSFIGVFVCCCFLTQYGIGIAAYLAPKWSQPKREAFRPVHAFLGLSTFVAGIATMGIGIQEKTTFVQMITKPGVTSVVMRVPAVLILFLATYAISVLYYHAFSFTTETRQIQQRYLDLDAEELIT